ncbi:hypothetical protein GDO81_013688 [Engystomops pustulosus]|uniref:Uncharacterized protein n=1 Tax=Engystomops pustulosus TaxID=76066 RepID=A0AAV7B4W1_ENGPU|nr:hypothetical protein GDO81_013688 [Engystomops pustulosus]
MCGPKYFYSFWFSKGDFRMVRQDLFQVWILLQGSQNFSDGLVSSIICGDKITVLLLLFLFHFCFWLEAILLSQWRFL